MDTYYIKNIWGPAGRESYLNTNQTEFAEGQERAAKRFSECDGFFLYETGGKEGDKEGAQTIYTQGIIQASEIIVNKDTREYGEERGQAKKFPYVVKIDLSMSINPLDGVPLHVIRKILESPKERMQRPGGLIQITKEQFDQLSFELQKRSRSKGSK